MTRVVCGDCRFWTPKGVQNSGIPLPERSGPWFYSIGECSQGPEFGELPPAPAHYGGIVSRHRDRSGHLGLPPRGDQTVPEWGGCWIGKRRVRVT